MALLTKLNDYLLQEVAWDNLLSEDELVQIRMMISSLMGLFHKQEEHGTLSKRQKALLKQFSEVENILNKTQIINRADQKVFSLWSFLEENSDAQDALALPNAMIYFKDRIEGHQVYEKCHKLEKRLKDITANKGIIGRICRFSFEDAFGTINQVREEIQARYECKPTTLQVDKKTSLDCLFIAGRSGDDISMSVDTEEGEKKTETFDHEGDSNYYLQYAAKGTRHLKTTVIVCCPNSTFYEYSFHENEWIDLYLRNGINVFLWNYRGYGRSTGTPSPHILKKDGEYIVDYLRREMGIKRLGAHGESVGGVIAAHLAKAKSLDFLYLDRNFANLSQIGELTCGTSFLGRIYKHLTMWTDDICSDYLEAGCYKLISTDPKDESVPLLSSLKYAVTSRILAHNKKLENEDFGNDLQPLGFLNKFKNFRRFRAYSKKVENIANDYYDLLSKEQMIALFWSLSRVSQLFGPLSKIESLPSTRREKKAHSIDDLSADKIKAPTASKHERRGSLDSSVINHKKNTDSQILDDQRKSVDDSVMEDGKYMNETLDVRSFAQHDDDHLIKTAKRKGYVNLFNEEVKSSSEIISLLVKVFATFESLEAGGLHLSDVLSTGSDIRYEAFMHFINSFEVWGSYFPLQKIIEDEPKTLTYFQNHALNKIKEFIKRLDHMANKQKQKPDQRNQNKLVSALLEDIEIITSIMPTLFQKLTMKFGASASPMGDSNFITHSQDEVHIDIENASQVKETAGGKFVALQAHTSRYHHGGHTISDVGNLVPLGCSQNEGLNDDEIELCEYHLRSSQLI